MKEKIGIERRYVANDDESVGDMGEKAVNKLFQNKKIFPSQIDLFILCTQNPDYVLPTTACILQSRLGMNKNTICFDINLGCSGFVYACGIASSMLVSLNLKTALIVTTEAYSKKICYDDKTVATLFSDGAAATILEAGYENCELLDFDFGTDGTGYSNLIVPVSGSKRKHDSETCKMVNYGNGVSRSQENLFMDGHEISRFVLKEVPNSVSNLLNKQKIDLNSVDKIVFHQANKHILETLSKKLNLERDKVFIDLSVGNTVSSTIPIALKQMFSDDNLNRSMKIILSGFGVGYSWASMLIETKPYFGEYL